MCKRDDVDDEDDWWQFNLTVRYGRWGDRTEYHFIQNKNGQRLKMNRDYTLTMTSDTPPPESVQKTNRQLFRVDRTNTCYYKIWSSYSSRQRTLFFRGDECVLGDTDTVVEKETLVLMKRDPNAPPTTALPSSTGGSSVTTPQSRWRKRQNSREKQSAARIRRKNQRRTRSGGKYGKK